jgi:hypothetical protein
MKGKSLSKVVLKRWFVSFGHGCFIASGLLAAALGGHGPSSWSHADNAAEEEAGGGKGHCQQDRAGFVLHCVLALSSPYHACHVFYVFHAV